jgi:hypothetical protein
MSQPYLRHLQSAASLQTTDEGYRAGVAAFELEKNRRATPYVAEARTLQYAASQTADPIALLQLPDIQGMRIPMDAANFVEELVFRFLLTRGDTLGGSMRNVGGFMAQCKLTRSIIAHLKLAGKPYRWLHGVNNVWADMPEEDAGIELNTRGLSWQTAGQSRTLLYNLLVPLFRNNVDFCLFNCAPENLGRQLYNNPAAYIALGELKGGIDPAGADEHWKTAHTALSRIQEAFAKHKLKPHTFFIGAAIEAKMAKEIWSLLKRGTIENAANLTDVHQIASVTRWLCSL